MFDTSLAPAYSVNQLLAVAIADGASFDQRRTEGDLVEAVCMPLDDERATGSRKSVVKQPA